MNLLRSEALQANDKGLTGTVQKMAGQLKDMMRRGWSAVEANMLNTLVTGGKTQEYQGLLKNMGIYDPASGGSMMLNMADPYTQTRVLTGDRCHWESGTGGLDLEAIAHGLPSVDLGGADSFVYCVDELTGNPMAGTVVDWGSKNLNFQSLKSMGEEFASPPFRYAGREAFEYDIMPKTGGGDVYITEGISCGDLGDQWVASQKGKGLTYLKGSGIPDGETLTGWPAILLQCHRRW